MMTGFKKINIKAIALAAVLTSPFAAYGMDKKDEKSQQKEQKDFKGQDGKEQKGTDNKEQKLQPQNKVMSLEQKKAMLKEMLGEEAQCSICQSLLLKETDDKGAVIGDYKSEIFVTCITPTNESNIPVHACHKECFTRWAQAKVERLAENYVMGINPVEQENKFDLMNSGEEAPCAMCGKNVKSLDRQMDLLILNEKKLDDNQLCRIAKVFLCAANYIIPLHKAAHQDKVQLIEFLIKAGANINEAADNIDCPTPLIVAVLRGHDKSVEALIKAGAHVNQLNKDGLSPLHVAASSGHDKFVERLINAGAKVNQPAESGATPLLLAIISGHENCVERLIKAGANVNQPVKNGYAPLHIAAIMGHDKLVERLIKADAKIDQSCNDGETPLFLAAENGKDKSVEALIKAGAKIDQSNNAGLSPLWIALQNGHHKCVVQLQPPSNYSAMRTAFLIMIIAVVLGTLYQFEYI